MTERKFDTAVLVGRFAPWRQADRVMLDTLLAMADSVVVAIGTADAPCTIRTPWTASAREAIIRADIGPEPRVSFAHLSDHLYRLDRWQVAVRDCAPQGNVCVAGLDLPGWQSVAYADPGLPGAQVREGWFTSDDTVLSAAVSPAVKAAMGQPSAELRAEFDYIADYKRSWAAAPWPPILVTVDTAIVHADAGGTERLLLIQRGHCPGKGLWALPGGFVDQEETLAAAALRELREETGLDGQGVIRRREVFDAPFRSSRGRTISHCFLIDATGDLPTVIGTDDAAEARWFTLDEVKGMRDRMFEDHYSIIEFLLD